jgi:LysM repeat protein
MNYMLRLLTSFRPSGLALLAAIFLPLLLDSCSTGNPKFDGLPEKLPAIALNGSARTPAHNMQSTEYPFDSNGNYVAEWAAEGERRQGRPAAATNDDEVSREKSHGGKVTGSRKIAVKSKASEPKTKTKNKSGTKEVAKSSDKTTSKSSSATKKPTGSSSVRYVVKKGDTLSSIADKFGSSIAKFKAANGLKSNTLSSGTSLKVPK